MVPAFLGGTVVGGVIVALALRLGTPSAPHDSVQRLDRGRVDAEIVIEAEPKTARVRTARAPDELRSTPTTLAGAYGDVIEAEVQAPGFEPKRVRVAFDPGQSDRVLKVVLDPKPVLLQIDARPAGARVAVNGVAYTEPVFVDPGSPVAVDVILPGYAPEHRDVVPVSGAPLLVVVELSRRGR
jgi:hypothetical protein